jgi:outer membrane protein insertion porin family
MPEQVVVNVDVEEQPTGSLNFGAVVQCQLGHGLDHSALPRTTSLAVASGVGAGLNITDTQNGRQLDHLRTEPALAGPRPQLKFGGLYKTSDYANANYDTRNIGFPPARLPGQRTVGRLDLRYALFSMRKAVDPGDPADSNRSGHPSCRRGQRRPDRPSIGYSYSYDNKHRRPEPQQPACCCALARISRDLAAM